MDAIQYEYEALDVIRGAFTHTAEALCGEIDSFRPDLVIALAHSGWLPVSAARERWRHTRRRPFPPVARTNIGREKTALFDSLPNEAGRISWNYGVTGRDAAYLLSQVEGKTEWTETLRRQVEEALGEGVQPERLLFVDEFSYSGKTAYLVLDLAERVFPQADIRLVSASMEGIAEGLMLAWLKEYHPPIAEILSPSGVVPASISGKDSASAAPDEEGKSGQAGPAGAVQPARLSDKIAALVPGTEDVVSNSLEWRAIQPGGQVLKALAAAQLPLSEAEWMDLPRWTERTISEAALREPVLRLRAYDRRRLLASHSILPEQRILALAFRQGVVTRTEAAKAAGQSPARAAKLLADLVDRGDLYPEGYGRDRVFHLAPDILEQSSPVNEDLFERFNAFWLIPDQWLIVPHLLENREEIDDWLAANRINHFIFLDQPARDNPGEYRKRLEARWGSPLPKVRISGLGQSFYPDTNPEGLSVCLLQIRKALKRGDIIVLSASISPERSGMIAAAYLIEEGLTPEEAFRKLDALRAHLPGGWKPFPARSWMRTLVRKWAKMQNGVLSSEGR